mgnify:FL=1
MNYPKIIQSLIDCFKKIPGVGEKTAERYVLSLLDMDDDVLNEFADHLKNLKHKIVRCKVCHNLSEGEICDICKDTTRDHSTICVVEEPKNVFSFEKAGTYLGTYHVLDGLISPLEGIRPENINIASLLERVEKESIKEVIIAVKACVEGETTAMYIAKKLENKNVKVSKIAYGIPLGADMGYIDASTLEISLENRQQIHN